MKTCTLATGGALAPGGAPWEIMEKSCGCMLCLYNQHPCVAKRCTVMRCTVMCGKALYGHGSWGGCSHEAAPRVRGINRNLCGEEL